MSGTAHVRKKSTSELLGIFSQPFPVLLALCPEGQLEHMVPFKAYVLLVHPVQAPIPGYFAIVPAGQSLQRNPSKTTVNTLSKVAYHQNSNRGHTLHTWLA